jgi:hypothetical protein
VPTIEGGRFAVMHASGSFGALPISPWLLQTTGLFDRYFGKLFSNQSQEKQVLDSLTSISVTPKEVVLKYQPH